jgi:2-oxoglutarate dehydrogenase E1 component
MDVEADEKEKVIDVFRTWGYLEADLVPLRVLPPLMIPDLELTGPVAESARAMYCGTIGVEFMHIPERRRREWIREKFESAAPEPDRSAILDRLIRAKVFEQMLHARYPGTKRYSLEGAVALIPLLDEILESASGRGAVELVLAMSHRGRLNVMVNVVGRTPAEIFTEFEDVDPASVLGGGDVKYHIGATGAYKTRDGRTIGIHLVSNPSHLEAVDPVAMGRARAKQKRLGSDGAAKVLPITVHGDAAFAGQGIWSETLNMSSLKGYSVHGTIHVIVNNLLGFTAKPAELHSSRFAADLAKRQSITVFHVNAEDPDAVVRVARLAVDYRYQFSDDVVVDLIGFRLHGHSEVDEPSVTQPLLYDRIRKHPPLWIHPRGSSSCAWSLARHRRLLRRRA